MGTMTITTQLCDSIGRIKDVNMKSLFSISRYRMLTTLALSKRNCPAREVSFHVTGHALLFHLSIPHSRP
jgi:hypothetical protein